MAVWIYIVEWVSRFILLGLIGLSVWSISIMIDRRRFFKLVQSNNEDAQVNRKKISSAHNKEELMQWAQGPGLSRGSVKAALEMQSSEQMERAVNSYISSERPQYEKGLSILGTLGAITPFIGLLGTILGIIVAFGNLSTGQMDSQKVMYALAEALIMTAVGLGVAIPAVVANNYFNRQLGNLIRECDSLKDLIIAKFSRGV